MRSVQRDGFPQEEAHFTMFSSFMDYFNHLDLGSTLGLETKDGRFKSFSYAQAATREAQKHCRPILGLDGTFTKGKWIYCILVAVTLDAND